jgi:hypothetical protein
MAEKRDYRAIWIGAAIGATALAAVAMGGHKAVGQGVDQIGENFDQQVDQIVDQAGRYFMPHVPGR